MFLGRVIGRLVPAVVCDGLAGVPMLWVQPLDKHGQAEGPPFVCADGTLEMARRLVEVTDRAGEPHLHHRAVGVPLAGTAAPTTSTGVRGRTIGLLGAAPTEEPARGE